MTLPIQYGYVEGGYVDPGYIADVAGVQFVHSSGTLTFARSPKYPPYAFQFVQAEEQTTTGRPIVRDPAVTQIPFTATWPFMSDAELAALRTFMFSTLPVYDQFECKLSGQDMSFIVRFAALKLKCRHVIPGFNEVTISLVRV